MTDILKSAVTAIRRRAEERAAFAALGAMSERELRDIGLSRGDIRGAVRHGRRFS